MADTVTTRTLYESPNRLVVQLTNKSDGTGESAVVKVDKSTFTGMNGSEPSKFAVEQVIYNCDGMNVQLAFDRTTDLVIGVYSQSGHHDFRKIGGFVDTSTGDTGDILLTTTGHSVGDSYDIILHLRKKD